MAEIIAGVGSAAAVTQLLAQTINLVQKIRSARAGVRGKSRLLDRCDEQLHSLVQTLELVKGETELQNSEIQEQVEDVRDAAEELHSEVASLRDRQAKGKMRQYGHEVFSSEKDDEVLDKKMHQLDRIMKRLDTRILVANVGLTGSLGEGLRANMSVVERVDRGVQGVMNVSLRMAEVLRTRERDVAADGTVPLSGNDLNSIGVVRDRRIYLNNTAYDRATVINSDLRAPSSQTITNRRYENNSARGQGLLVNGDMDGNDFKNLLASRWGK